MAKMDEIKEEIRLIKTKYRENDRVHKEKELKMKAFHEEAVMIDADYQKYRK